MSLLHAVLVFIRAFEDYIDKAQEVTLDISEEGAYLVICWCPSRKHHPAP